MSDDQFLPDAVQWSEGMLLSPQHFQQHDIYTQAVLHQRVLGVSAYCWGVRHLKLDSVRLASGEVCITEFDGVMPDGLPISFSTADGRAPAVLNVSAQCLPDGRAVKVWLAIPPRTGAMSVPSTSIRRYESLSGQETIDEVTGIGDVLVERQRARIELFAGEKLPPGYPAICLMELARSAQGEIEQTSFHPPMLRLGASRFLAHLGLLQTLGVLRELMWKKLRELSGSAQEDAPESLAVLNVQARMHLAMARDVAACLPLLDVVLMDPLATPHSAYTALAHIVGRIASIGSNPRPLAMTPYDHDNCISQFSAAIQFITSKLNLINTDWDNLAFARVEDGLFARRLPEEAGSHIYIELRARDGQTSAELQAWLAEAYVGSEELLPTLRQRRISGAKRRLLSSREAGELGLRAGALVCELQSQKLELPPHGLVDSFRAGRSMLIKGSQEKSPAAIILHHRKRAGTAVSRAAQGTEEVHA